MGLLARIHSERRSYTLSGLSLKDPAAAKLFGYRPVDAGVHVDESVALTFSAVWDAVQQISADTAKVPLVLKKRDQTGAKHDYVESKLYKLLHDEPNDEMTSMVFRRTVTAHALTWGNGYAEIERDGGDRPRALWVLTPDRVRVEREQRPDGRLGRLRYVIDGGKTTLEARDVLHIAGPSYDGIIGYNLVNFARQAIGLALASEKFASMFFANGSTFGGILSGDGDYDENEVQKAIEELQNSVNKASRFLVLPAGYVYHKIAVNPSESQMRETRDKQVEEVARFYNMPLHKLKNLDRATNNNIEHQDLEYYKGCLLNWYTGWEQELNRKLIPSLEYRRQFFKHNVEGFLRADSKTRNEALGMQRDRGIINADEWRDLDDRNPQPGGQGQLYLVQQQYVPVDRLAAMIEAKITAVKTKTKATTKTGGGTPQDGEETDARVRTADERARIAEQLAAAAREDAAEARRRLAETEGSLTATREELAQRRQDVQRALDAEHARRAAEDRAREAVDAVTIAREEASDARRSLAEAEGRLAATTSELEQRRQDVRRALDAETARESAEVRAREATAAADTVRTDAADALRRLADAEGRLATTTTELDQRRTEVQQAVALAAELERAAEAQRAEATALRQQHEAVVSELTTERQARVEAERLAAAATARAERADADRVQAAADLSEAIERERVAREAVAAAEARATSLGNEGTRGDQMADTVLRAVSEAVQALVAARTTFAEESGIRATLERQLGEMEARAVAARAEAERLLADAHAAAEAERVARRQEAEAREAAERAAASSDAARAAVEARLADATTAAEQAQAELAAATARMDTLAATAASFRDQVSAAEDRLAAAGTAHSAELEALRQTQATVDTQLAEARSRVASLEAEAARAAASLQTQRDGEMARMTGMIGALRGLFEDAVGRMVRWEADRARRNQTTPAKLRAWLDAFYVGHEDSVADALLRPVRVHLAWTQSAEDPATVARTLARDHVKESLRQLRAIAECEPEDLHVTLERMLQRWEDTRPAALADRMLKEEVDHVRACTR